MQNKHRLAIITSHPIQYNAPLFKKLNERGAISVKVFYTWGENSIKDKFDPGFGKHIKWDIPLLEGYDYEFLKNVATDPGSHHFNGIINPEIINKIRDWAPNTILVYSWNFNSHLKVLRYFHNRVPILFRGDSTLLDESSGFSLKKIIRHNFLKWVYKYIDVALYVGSENKKYFLASKVPKENLYYAPHAIDLIFFSDKKYNQDAHNIRSSLNIKETDIVLLYAGKFQENKDPQLLVNAFMKIDKPFLHLILVGNGELEVELKKIASASKNIHFINFQNQSQMPVVYRIGDIFVLPSKRKETWGLAINEAMACSRAIIASTKCGCSADLISIGENGYVFKSNDGQDLLHKIELMLEDIPKIAEMGDNSLQIIKEWNYDKVCNTIEKILIKEKEIN